jgi:crotonobetainyl-CoA:carnitine CoA-transferase CaiB-like acyl-CoA transferase
MDDAPARHDDAVPAQHDDAVPGMRPLDGVFVLDFSTLLPGPMASLLLAEAGAEVVKIERPGSGEEMRSYAPKWGRESVNFALLNRGKKSIALDLKVPADLQRARDLVRRADIVLEQFRPGVMDRLGLGYQALRAINPRLIYCSITGYGSTGPKSTKAGHDLNYIGDTGLLALSMGEAPRHTIPPALLADIAGGAYPAVINILLAIEERRRTGVGRHLQIAMADNLFAFMYWAIGSGLGAGQWPGNGTDLVTGGSPRYRLYPTKDAKVVAAAPLEDRFWASFCETIGLEAELREDTRDPAQTARRVAEIIAADDAQHWQARFDAADCCCTIVADLRTAMTDPHFRARGLFDFWLVNEAGQTLPALPVPIDAAFRGPPGEGLAAPTLGAHNGNDAG